ncbi:hypothetical protein XH87_11590 [Bradyrhizobium sp. CCBAU 53415]|nr:hypothetical protein [Bradyrhizobium sp. CCBAU 53415]
MGGDETGRSPFEPDQVVTDAFTQAQVERDRATFTRSRRRKDSRAAEAVGSEKSGDEGPRVHGEPDLGAGHVLDERTERRLCLVGFFMRHPRIRGGRLGPFYELR